MSLIGLDPTSGPMPESSPGEATRPSSLDGRGRRDRVERSRRERPHPAGRLPRARRRVGGAERAVFVRKPSVSVPPDPMDWEKLISQVTVAVAGFGG